MKAQRPARHVLLVEEGGIGGVAHYTDALAGALAQAGWGVALASGRDHPRDRPAGVEVRRIFPYVRGRTAAGRALRRLRLSRPLNGLTHLAANALLAAAAREADVVHTQGGEWPPLAAAQALMLRAAGRPIVHTPHNVFDRSGRAYARSFGLIWRTAARIVVHSEFDRSHLPPSAARKAVIIPHGEYGHLAATVPDLDEAACRAELGAGEQELLVLLFGQLRPDKGVGDLLQAAAQAPAVRIVLAGEDAGALSQVSALLDDERLRGRVVVEPGFVEPARATKLFAACDLVALPYHRASASGVLLLAYGYARPVLAYPVGGLPEYVQDGVTGWLCDRCDPQSLADSLRATCEAGRAECRARGTAALQLSERRYAWPAVAASTIALYEEAIRSYG